MKITNITAIFYSATGNTRKVIKGIAENIQETLQAPLNYIDYTRPQNRKLSYSFGPEDLVIFASCVYAGRIPNKMTPYISTTFSGTNTPMRFLNSLIFFLLKVLFLFQQLQLQVFMPFHQILDMVDLMIKIYNKFTLFQKLHQNIF